MKHFTPLALVALGCTLLFASQADAQWSSVGFTSNMVHQAAELGGKLYVATGGAGLQEMDGTSWTTLNNFNNSSNTPHKEKTSVVAINGMLYTGAGDFNTSGEGAIHTFNGTDFSLLQNSDFYYDAQFEITGFVEYNGEVYAGGMFDAPVAGTGGTNLAKWNGTDWIGVGTGTVGTPANIGVVSQLLIFQSKLYAITTQTVYFYDGTTWDSIPHLYDSYTNAAVYNGELFLSGSVYTYNGTTPTGSGSLAKWNGTTVSIVHNASGPYPLVRRLFSDGTHLYATAKVTSQGGDAYLIRYDGSTWSNFAFLEESAGGFTPGYPIYDYNCIFKFNNALYVGGRFTAINNQPIANLAKMAATSGIVETPENMEASVYPNPASSVFTVKLSDSNLDRQLIVTSVTGQQVLTQDLTGATTAISTTGLRAGTYFYQILEGQNPIATGKLVIE